MKFSVEFSGHPCVRSTHSTTVELTRSGSLTPAGDCVLGVSASCGCAGLPEDLKRALRLSCTRVRLSFSSGPHEYRFEGSGDPRLTLSDPDDLVMRTSSFACPRTLAVRCTRAADSMPRALVGRLQDPDSRGTLTVEAPAQG